MASSWHRLHLEPQSLELEATIPERRVLRTQHHTPCAPQPQDPTPYPLNPPTTGPYPLPPEPPNHRTLPPTP
jgi:hypothetical protein